MSIPRRTGIPDEKWERMTAPLERAREKTLRQVDDPTDLGGLAVIWYRTPAGALPRAQLGIQPGVADDLPSLLSSLAPEIGWPGAPAPPAATPSAPANAVAVWARLWQVRDRGDLRVRLYWRPDGVCVGGAELLVREGPTVTLHEVADLAALLDQVAVAPQASRSPHGLALAGNRAMEAQDYARAREYYAEALMDLPHHLEARRNLALAQARLGLWDAAVETMRQTRALAPQDAILTQEYLALRTDAGVAAAQQGKLAQAAEHFLAILQEWPDEPTALANLGGVRLREDRLPEARAIYRRFLRHHPDHPAAATIRLALEEMGEA